MIVQSIEKITKYIDGFSRRYMFPHGDSMEPTIENEK